MAPDTQQLRDVGSFDELTHAPAGRRIELFGVNFDAVTEAEAVARVVSLSPDEHGRVGGWVLTPNLDILRSITRDPEVRALVEPGTLVVADGMPLVWASKLQGTPLPERVAGSSMLLRVCAAAPAGHSIFLLGGAAGVAEQAATALGRKHPAVRIGGWSPPFGIEATPEGQAEIVARLRGFVPDIVFCGFGFPKQEILIRALRPEFPKAWFVGCGAAIDFAAGRVRRAPTWMQRAGLEWLHRLACEPRRLARRYLVNDLPFAAGLLLVSLRRRWPTR